MNTLETVMYDWKTLNWRKLEQVVFKLQKRIYRAACRDEVKTVHQLQRLLIKSKAAALLAVRRVTQINRGKRTAGIDGLASLTNKERLELVREILRKPLPPNSKDRKDRKTAFGNTSDGGPSQTSISQNGFGT